MNDIEICGIKFSTERFFDDPCNRRKGHEGPCQNWPIDDNKDLVGIPKLPSGWRWAKQFEVLPETSRWFDSFPRDTTTVLLPTDELGIFEMNSKHLSEMHEDRHKDWPSDEHGLCGIVIPIN